MHTNTINCDAVAKVCGWGWGVTASVADKFITKPQWTCAYMKALPCPINSPPSSNWIRWVREVHGIRICEPRTRIKRSSHIASPTSTVQLHFMLQLCRYAPTNRGVIRVNRSQSNVACIVEWVMGDPSNVGESLMALALLLVYHRRLLKRTCLRFSWGPSSELQTNHGMRVAYDVWLAKWGDWDVLDTEPISSHRLRINAH